MGVENGDGVGVIQENIPVLERVADTTDDASSEIERRFKEGGEKAVKEAIVMVLFFQLRGRVLGGEKGINYLVLADDIRRSCDGFVATEDIIQILESAKFRRVKQWEVSEEWELHRKRKVDARRELARCMKKFGSDEEYNRKIQGFVADPTSLAVEIDAERKNPEAHWRSYLGKLEALQRALGAVTQVNEVGRRLKSSPQDLLDNDYPVYAATERQALKWIKGKGILGVDDALALANDFIGRHKGRFDLGYGEERSPLADKDIAEFAGCAVVEPDENTDDILDKDDNPGPFPDV